MAFVVSAYVCALKRTHIETYSVWEVSIRKQLNISVWHKRVPTVYVTLLSSGIWKEVLQTPLIISF